MAASDSLIDSRVGFWVKLSNKHTAEIQGLRDVTMATTFWLSMGYNFSCVIVSLTLFDYRVVDFSWSSYPMKTQPRSRV